MKSKSITLKHYLTILFLSIWPYLTFAISNKSYDFIVGHMRYKITSYQERTVEFVAVDHSYSGPNHTGLQFAYSEDISIPENVTYAGIDFTVTSFGEYCCEGHPCSSVTVPSTVQTIGKGSFANCTNLTSVKIPLGVKELGKYVFDGCSGITDIILPSTIKKIGNDCFRGTSLSTFVCPDSLSSIGDGCFYDCKALTNVVFNDCLIEIGSMAFSDTPLTELNLPKGLRTIGSNAFENTKIKTVTIPENVTIVQGFQRCEDLEEVILPDSVLEIGNFAHCYNLRKLELRHCSYLSKIESYTFAHSGLKSLVLPDTVYTWIYDYDKWGNEKPGTYRKVKGKISLSEYCFNSMNLDTLVLTQAVSYITTAFEGTTIKNLFVKREVPLHLSNENTFSAETFLTGVLHVPSGTKELYATAPVWKNFINIVDDIDIYTADTAIEQTYLDLEKNEVYNMQGLRIIETDKLTRGIYIVNGKKMFVK